MSKDDKIKELTLRGMEQDRQKLLMRQPFIGMILMHLDFVPITSGCRTACTDGSRVFMNCQFYAKLDLEERLFVLAHETWHCVLLHFARLQNRNPDEFNYATDLEIHFILQKEKMKEPFVLPHDPEWDGLSAEEIYEKLGHKKEYGGKREKCKNPGCCSKGFDSNEQSFDEHVYAGTAKQDSENDPDFAPCVSAQSVENMRQIVIQTACSIERRQGTLPGNLKEIVDRLRKPELNWKELLKQFVTSCFGGSRRWLPPARRYVGMGLYLQSRRDEKFNAVMAIDTSGSTSEDLPQFFAELSSLLKSFGNYELTVIQCDAEIQHVEKFSGDTPLPSNYQWTSYGHGGTSFIPPFEYVKEHKLRPDIFIYLTDGYGDAPEKAPCFPVLWVLADAGKQPADWGKSICLKKGAEMNKTALNQDFYAEKYKSAMSLLKLAVQSCRIDLIAYILTYINLQEEERALIFAIFCKRVCLEKYASWRGTELAAKFTGLQKTVPLKRISLSETEKKFLERIRSNNKLPLLQQTITDALRKDSVSAFEIALLICNQRISLHHIYTALTSDARNIVILLMQKYSGRIFKLRSPQEWLFIICNNFCNSAAITAIRCIEEIFPGIVKSSKDPWGCNLLWHTLYNDLWLQEEYCRLEKLQNELIKLDCDPDEKNSIGLSFNLIKEYDKC